MATPVTTPVVELIVAIDGMALVQVPPPGAEVAVMFAVTHTAVGPLTGDGNGLTVMLFVAGQPVLPTV